MWGSTEPGATRTCPRIFLRAYATEEHRNVVTGDGLVGGLVERLDAGHDRRTRRAETDDIDRVTDRDEPWSTSPVTTVPRPVMVMTFSTDMRNG